LIDTQRLRLTLIDINLQLRAVIQTVMANAGQVRIVARQL
jgi:hypothetical protein